MRERQASHASSAGDTQRVLNRAVAPPSLQPVLLGQILGIMDQEIGASEELHVAPIAPVKGPFPAAKEVANGSWSRA